jgi:hypothetical protein
MNYPPWLRDERADPQCSAAAGTVLASLSGRIICKFLDLHNTELTMKRFAFAVGLLALGSAAATPARADYAVVRFETGYCQIWWDAGDVPWGVNWTKVAITPDWASAYSSLYAAIAARTCN